jgi:hypothetical protein
MDTTIYSDNKGTKVTTHEFVTRDAIYLVPGIIDARINQVKFSAVARAILHYLRFTCLLFRRLQASAWTCR